MSKLIFLRVQTSYLFFGSCYSVAKSDLARVWLFATQWTEGFPFLQFFSIYIQFPAESQLHGIKYHLYIYMSFKVLCTTMTLSCQFNISMINDTKYFKHNILKMEIFILLLLSKPVIFSLFPILGNSITTHLVCLV